MAHYVADRWEREMVTHDDHTMAPNPVEDSLARLERSQIVELTEECSPMGAYQRSGY